MTPNELTDALKNEAARLGFDLCGATPAADSSDAESPDFEHFERWLTAGHAGKMHYMHDRADAYRHPRHVLEGVKSVLMLGLNYRSIEPDTTRRGQGRISRYAWGPDYHDPIREKLHALADFHRHLVPEARTRGIVDTAPLLERAFARRAGLGWIGKNTMLINRQLGSWFFLAALLTTEELAPDAPEAEDHCKGCRKCLDACPTGALVDAYQLDARKCISYLTIELRESIPMELRPQLGDRVFGCDACQDACPHNRRFEVDSAAADTFQPTQGMYPMVLTDLFALDEADWRRCFHKTPLARCGRRGLLRNAAIVLGNRLPEGMSMEELEANQAILTALVQGLEDDEPLVRIACAWSLGRWPAIAAGDALQNRLPRENESDVRAEIEMALKEAGKR